MLRLSMVHYCRAACARLIPQELGAVWELKQLLGLRLASHKYLFAYRYYTVRELVAGRRSQA